MNTQYPNQEHEAQEDVTLCDLYLAAALNTAGIKHSQTSVVSKRVYFHFPKDDGLLTRIRREYMSRTLQIDALSFADQIKSLKSLCAELTGSSRR